MTDPSAEDSDRAPDRRERIRRIIFEANTPRGKAFDVLLIWAILASVLAVFLDSVVAIHAEYGRLLYAVEWGFTIAFTVEYVVRLWCVEKPRLYARSFYGVVDLMGILPTYLSLLVPGTQYLLVVRILRVLRVFRVLRMVRYVGEATFLLEALRESRRKIFVFLYFVLTLVVVFGSLLYIVEGPQNGFTSIPTSIYWAIVTLTTVGYGDISPQTPVGQLIASVVMIMGYGIIAVPTGIVTVELSEATRRRANTRSCPVCSAEGHAPEAGYCWRCGGHLVHGAGGQRPAPVGDEAAAAGGSRAPGPEGDRDGGPEGA